MASGLISTEQFEALLAEGNVTVLDVRGPTYFMGHIPGAVATRWQDFTDANHPVKGMLHADANVLAERFSALGVKNDRPVVICSEPFENWGAEGRFFWMLHYLGHEGVHVLDGGYPKWKQEKRATNMLPHRASAGAFTPAVRPETLIGRDEVAACANAGDAVIVDTRSEKEYRKEGRVPGARHLSWMNLYAEDGTFLPPEKLAEQFAGAGLDPDKTIIPYCTGGVRSAVVFMILHLSGYKNIRNYDGSWWEWTHDGKMPVEK